MNLKRIVKEYKLGLRISKTLRKTKLTQNDRSGLAWNWRGGRLIWEGIWGNFWSNSVYMGYTNLSNLIELCTLFSYFYFILFFCYFRARPTAYGGSQARGPIGATAASLHNSHSNTGSKPPLRLKPQLTVMTDPQPTEQGQGLNPHLHGS